MQVGEQVIYVDPCGVGHDALITAIWGKPEDKPCINVVFVSDDQARQDAYGRQLERQTSVVYRTAQPAHGNYYMFPGEPRNPVASVQV